MAALHSYCKMNDILLTDLASSLTFLDVKWYLYSDARMNFGGWSGNGFSPISSSTKRSQQPPTSCSYFKEKASYDKLEHWYHEHVGLSDAQCSSSSQTVQKYITHV